MINEQGSNLIFLISQPRSGSTLLQRMLGGHSQIHTTAEPWVMLHPLYALKREGYSADYNAAWARAALDDFLKNLPGGEQTYLQAVGKMSAYLYRAALESSGKSYFLDKTPRYYTVLPQLFEVFPQAKFIFLLRNPLAVLASILENWVREDWEKLALFRQDIFLAPVKIAEAIERHPQRATVCHYEDLVQTPEKHMRELCAALDIPFEPDMLDYGRHEPLRGSMGDSGSVAKFSRPVADRLNVWVEQLDTPERRFLAELYLSYLNAGLAGNLHYAIDELKNMLLSRPLQGPPLPSAGQDELLAALDVTPFELACMQIRDPRKAHGADLSAEAEARLITELRAAGLEVEDVQIDADGYEKFMEQANYEQNHPDFQPFNRAEKTLEHYVVTKLLNLEQNDRYVDFSAEPSPAPDIFRNLFGLNSQRVGAPFSSERVKEPASKIAVHGIFEHLEGETDIAFLKQLPRLLQTNGQVCILPLFFAEQYGNQTDPQVALSQNVVFDEDAVVYCAEGWNNRFARFYDAEHFVERFVRALPGFEIKICRIVNAKSIDRSVYLRFAAVLTKKKAVQPSEEKQKETPEDSAPRRAKSAEIPIAEKLMFDAPRFHDDGSGQLTSFHSNHQMLRELEKILQPGMRTLETGAGHSTVVFALRECRHICVTPSRKQAERITEYLKKNSHSTENLQFKIGSSTEILPALSEEKLDVVLVDGAHRFPYPIIDWFYGAQFLKEGGYLFLDDIDVISCFLLLKFLESDPHWQPLVYHDRFVVFRKIGDLTYRGDWARQPFSAGKTTSAQDVGDVLHAISESTGAPERDTFARNAQVCQRVAELLHLDRPLALSELAQAGNYLAELLSAAEPMNWASQHPEGLTDILFALLAVNIETAYEDGNHALARHLESLRRQLEENIDPGKQLLLRDKTLFFLHIPKTAGISMRQIIEAQFAPETILTFSGPGSRQNAITLFESMSEAEKRAIRLIQGHNVFGLEAFLPQEVTYFTMLRNPVDRAISHYYFLLRTPEHHDYEYVKSRNLSLKDYVLSGISKEINNGQTRMLAGRETWNFDFGQCPEEILEQAKENLQKLCSVVGLTERFDETVRLLCTVFNWKIPDYEKKNVSHNKPKRSQMDAETVRLLEKYNQLDVRLYRFAQDLFERQLQRVRRADAARGTSAASATRQDFKVSDKVKEERE